MRACHPQNDGVDAAIGAAAFSVDGQLEALAAYAPGHGPFAGMGLDRGDQPVGDGCVRDIFGEGETLQVKLQLYSWDAPDTKKPADKRGLGWKKWKKGK